MLISWREQGVWTKKIASVLHDLKSSTSPHLHTEQFCKAYLFLLIPTDRKQSWRDSVTLHPLRVEFFL